MDLNLVNYVAATGPPLREKRLEGSTDRRQQRGLVRSLRDSCEIKTWIAGHSERKRRRHEQLAPGVAVIDAAARGEKPEPATVAASSSDLPRNCSR